jgi:RNA polymerase sigma factor (sigma-70 family)
LRRFLARRLQNPADALDLMQEVYLRLMRVQRLDEIRSPEAYLLTIANNLLREHHMKQASVPAPVDIEDLVYELETLPEEGPVAQAESHERLKLIERVLDKLSPQAQAVLLMHRRDGCSLEEIAAELGVSRSMAKKYLAQALAKCRQRLAGTDEEV